MESHQRLLSTKTGVPGAEGALGLQRDLEERFLAPGHLLMSRTSSCGHLCWAQPHEAAACCKKGLARDTAALCTEITNAFMLLYMTSPKVEGREGKSSCFES